MYARAEETRHFIILERTETLTSEAKRSSNHKPCHEPQSVFKHGSEQSTRPLIFGLTHNKDFFFFLFSLRERGGLSPPHLAAGVAD
jgi:hypothetical protein